MIVTTTPNVEGKQIVEYKQVVFGEVIAGANFMRDFFAGITDVIGGRSSVYERRISRARQDALKELEEKAYALGANAIVGVEVNYTTVGTKSMFMVDALNGAPGLYSARYAGVDGEEADAKNREKLLAELSDVPSERRQAKFVSTIVLLQHPSDPSPIIAQGECEGNIIYEERGENGFGYDSLFFSPEKGCTFAELETVEKKKISHRAKALAVLKSKLTA